MAWHRLPSHGTARFRSTCSKTCWISSEPSSRAEREGRKWSTSSRRSAPTRTGWCWRCNAPTSTASKRANTSRWPQNASNGGNWNRPAPMRCWRQSSGPRSRSTKPEPTCPRHTPASHPPQRPRSEHYLASARSWGKMPPPSTSCASLRSRSGVRARWSPSLPIHSKPARSWPRSMPESKPPKSGCGAPGAKSTRD